MSTINLRQRLKQANMTQGQLAKAINVNPATVSRWCNMNTIPRHDYRVKVATVLNEARSAKPRTKLRKKARYTKTIATATAEQYTEEQVKKSYVAGFDYALTTARQLLAIPTDDKTKIKLLDTLTSTSVSFSPSK